MFSLYFIYFKYVWYVQYFLTKCWRKIQFNAPCKIKAVQKYLQRANRPPQDHNAVQAMHKIILIYLQASVLASQMVHIKHWRYSWYCWIIRVQLHNFLYKVHFSKKLRNYLLFTSIVSLNSNGQDSLFKLNKGKTTVVRIILVLQQLKYFYQIDILIHNFPNQTVCTGIIFLHFPYKFLQFKTLYFSMVKQTFLVF